MKPAEVWAGVPRNSPWVLLTQFLAGCSWLGPSHCTRSDRLPSIPGSRCPRAAWGVSSWSHLPRPRRLAALGDTYRLTKPSLLWRHLSLGTSVYSSHSKVETWVKRHRWHWVPDGGVRRTLRKGPQGCRGGQVGGSGGWGGDGEQSLDPDLISYSC